MDVLLAVPDELLHSLAGQVLTRAGATLHISPNPDEALIRFAERSYAIVVFDVTGNGHHDELLSMVRDRDPRPTVILTTGADNHDAFDVNLIHYVVRRPFDAGVVVGVILATMNRLRPS